VGKNKLNYQDTLWNKAWQGTSVEWLNCRGASIPPPTFSQVRKEKTYVSTIDQSMACRVGANRTTHFSTFSLADTHPLASWDHRAIATTIDISNLEMEPGNRIRFKNIPEDTQRLYNTDADKTILSANIRTASDVIRALKPVTEKHLGFRPEAHTIHYSTKEKKARTRHATLKELLHRLYTKGKQAFDHPSTRRALRGIGIRFGSPSAIILSTVQDKIASSKATIRKCENHRIQRIYEARKGSQLRRANKNLSREIRGLTGGSDLRWIRKPDGSLIGEKNDFLAEVSSQISTRFKRSDNVDVARATSLLRRHPDPPRRRHEPGPPPLTDQGTPFATGAQELGPWPISSRQGLLRLSERRSDREAGGSLMGNLQLCRSQRRRDLFKPPVTPGQGEAGQTPD
jgi:hypothetical protein